MKTALILTISCAYLTGCAGANIASQFRDSGEPGSNKMIRCTAIETGSEKASAEKLQKYDGWKAIYISEYTTPNKSSTSAVLCFEKPYK
jgi:hypothetical protein